MRLLISLFMVSVLAGCASDPAIDTTGTATIPAQTTTEPTVTTVTSTSTTAATTSTTRPATTSTTSPGGSSLDPDDLAVIASQFGALGWWDGSGWVEAGEAGDFDLTGDYVLVDLEGTDVATAATEDSFCAVELGGPYVGPALDFGNYDLAARVPWDLTPAVVTMLDPEADVYLDIVRQHLVGTDAEGTPAAIEQIVRVDLDANGVDEVLIVADSLSGDDLFGSEGDYSTVLFRTVIDDEVVMSELMGMYIGREFPSAYVLLAELVGVVDLNGDGRSEVVVVTNYYEGDGIKVFELEPDLATMTEVLGKVCGA